MQKKLKLITLQEALDQGYSLAVKKEWLDESAVDITEVEELTTGEYRLLEKDPHYYSTDTDHIASLIAEHAADNIWGVGEWYAEQIDIHAIVKTHKELLRPFVDAINQSIKEEGPYFNQSEYIFQVQEDEASEE